MGYSSTPLLYFTPLLLYSTSLLYSSTLLHSSTPFRASCLAPLVSSSPIIPFSISSSSTSIWGSPTWGGQLWMQHIALVFSVRFATSWAFKFALAFPMFDSTQSMWGSFKISFRFFIFLHNFDLPTFFLVSTTLCNGLVLSYNTHKVITILLHIGPPC